MRLDLQTSQLKIVLGDKIEQNKPGLLRLVRRNKKLLLTGSGKKCLICLDHLRAAILNLKFCINQQIKVLLKSGTL